MLVDHRQPAAEPPLALPQKLQNVGRRLQTHKLVAEVLLRHVSSLLTACVDLLQDETLTAALSSSVSLFRPAYVDTSHWEFPDVCRYYFGKFGQWSSLAFSMVSLIGAMVIYWVLMSNFLYNAGQFVYSKSLSSPLRDAVASSYQGGIRAGGRGQEG